MIPNPSLLDQGSEGELEAATERAETSLEGLIDRSYRRGLMLIGFLIVGGLGAALLYRLIMVRVIGSGLNKAA